MKKRTIKECFKYFVKPITKDKVEDFFKKIAITSIILFLTFTLAKSLEKEIPSIFLLDKGVVDSQITFYGYWFVLIIAILFCLYFFLFRRFKFQFWQYLIFSAVIFFYYELSDSPLYISWKFIDINESINAVDPFYYILILFFILNVLRTTIVSSYRVYKDIKGWNNERTESIEEVESKGLVKILNFIIDFNEWRKKSDTIFLEDNPLESEEDAASYTSLLEQIKPILYTDKYEKSFSVAIVGAWGSGKSSFIKALTKNIDDHNDEHLLKVEKQVLHFNFSPFLNHDENSIIKEFFTKLSHVLGKRSGKLSNQLIAYSKKLTNLAKEGDLLSFLTPVQSELFSQPANELYKSISDTIKSLNVKIVITIDDLDRLSGNEILEVLKLIRNTSNFPNTVFFVALDKGYVLKAIGKIDKIKYLDKFFQLEISISKIPTYRILKFLEEKLVSLFQETDLDIELYENFINLYKVKTLNIHISNYREAKRFYNQFVLDFKLINSFEGEAIGSLEIQIVDLINLTLLKLYYPETFSLLFKNLLYGFKEEKNFRALTSHKIVNMSNEKLSNVVESYLELESVERNKENSFVDLSLECKYLLTQLFGVRYDREIYNSFEPEANINSVVNTEVLSRYFERINYEGAEISNEEFYSVVNDNENYGQKISSIALDDNSLKSFSNKLHADNEINSHIKINCWHEVVKVKEFRFEKEMNYLIDCLFNSRDDTEFTEMLIRILEDNDFALEKKASFILLILGRFKEFNLALNSTVLSSIDEEIKRQTLEIIRLMSRSLNKGLVRFRNSWINLKKEELRVLMIDTIFKYFDEIDLIELCRNQLSYNSPDDNRVVVQPFIKNILGYDNLIKFLKTKEGDDIDELLSFFKLQKKYDSYAHFKGLRYFFDDSLVLEPSKNNIGEVLFEFDSSIEEELLSSSFLKSVIPFDDNISHKIFLGKDTSKSSFLLISIDTKFNDNFFFVKESLKEVLDESGIEYSEPSYNNEPYKWLLTKGSRKELVSIVSKQQC